MGILGAPADPSAGVGPARAAAFRRLCRSSPWRWETLRFSVEWTAAPGPAPTGPPAPGPGSGVVPVPRVDAWLRRPDALRVQDPEGTLLFSTTRINASRGSFYVAATRTSWLLPPRLTNPVYDDDGLVRRRPEAAYGDPVFGDPFWAAMLDPVELAGNAPVPTEIPFSNVVEIHRLDDALHHGRPVLEAVVSPNRTFRPACAGHPLIGAGRTRVAIDVPTGVCVATEVLDGPGAGAGHRIDIHGVDEYMLDDLFVEQSMHLTDVRDHIPWIVPPEGRARR
ncbi:hypothetical protein ACQ3I4_00865 [Zafaria sp. Z1313]|uniref:hypothetical protein n=1 Tax=unclassified Zafaria TaxID=2828765 RepID=UPI002E7A5B64|nr:hypothetical protein [Zafaria sp. J156]MEE1619932.1 hypothetical protein [Zafaria sp. J156]